MVEDPSALLAKVDLGLFGDDGMRDDGAAATMVAGEPILRSVGTSRRSRATDVAGLHDALMTDRLDVLKDARGTFSCAHYSRANRRLILATDKLGVRPLYWWTDGNTVVFSSILRLLESLTWVTKRPDARGIAEQIAFGFSLGARTPYEGVSLLRPGELLECDANGIVARDYWRWQDIQRSAEPLDTLTERAFHAFTDAVRIRQRGDGHATAFLSGGLDSRCVVAALRSAGVAVHSFNFFAYPTSEDRVFGAELARAAGTVHEEWPFQAVPDLRWSSMIAQARAGSTQAIKACVERPGLIWSGDGGSVGLGHVYLRPDVVNQCATGNLAAVADAYVRAERANLPKRLLRPEAKRMMMSAPRDGVQEELERLGTPDTLQTFYLMLLHNDQHRHLFLHFEEIDLHRIELQLPFFDAEFLGVIASIPIQERLYHRFYNKWLNHFPAYVAGTPWQAYPGHEPCPIPRASGLTYQWDPPSARTRAVARVDKVGIAVRTLLAPSFPTGMMRRSYLALATLLELLGLREMAPTIYAARSIRHYSDVCRRSIA